ncbi:MAG: tRNA threonylcarbamoyladenosine dehydratase [Bacteroidaceae bacterium]|nr:tRNA threonylcarbamoyladenosine dehydratase [Bacteroidaceae bacterium]
MLTEKSIFSRVELLLGQDFMDAISSKRVILFGVGGVGSWCAEGLIRSGIRNLTIVDCDRVDVSNINRQLMATTKTVGEVKVEALRNHLLEINPEANIEAVCKIFSEATAKDFALESFDYIIDAIDSLENKARLILMASETQGVFFSSMGAALKINPARVQVAEFWKVKGCPLGRALRQRFKKLKQFPKHKFLCVFSDELLTNEGRETFLETTKERKEMPDTCLNARSPKAQTNGSLVHITGIFGFTLSGLVIEDIKRKIS